MNDIKRRLMWHGMLLFLLGLLTGLVGEHFTNARMGLSAHLEGVMNGIVLIAVGGAWQAISLSMTSARMAFGLLLYGTYANWLVTTLAAVLGTGSMTPIAAGGRSAAPWKEALVSMGFASVALSMIAASVLLLIGFRGKARGPAAHDSLQG